MDQIADLRRRYETERRYQPFRALPRFGEEGLTLARRCRLARGDPAGDVPSGWVHYDDCREADGAMIEAKGNYADFLASSFGERKLTDEWLKQANRQVRAAGNRRVEWYFHDPEAAAFAEGLFAKNDLGSIGIHVLPYPGGVPKPNPRVR